MEISKYIDHTILRATATPKDIEKLCNEAKQYHFYSVCVNGCYVAQASKCLENTGIKVAAVVGFPLGAMTKEAKVFEAKDCIKNGASEIDMVINIGMLKAGEYDYVYEEIKAIKEAIGSNLLKVIIETCYLTDEEKKIASNLAIKAKAEYIKTSTGFGTQGATLHDVKIMLEVAKDKALVKASGGVKDYETAKEYIDLGVKRLGTSSGIDIVTKK